MSSDIEQAIRQICDEKGLSYEAVIETVEVALAAAYRKDYGNKMQNIEVEFDPADGNVKAFDVKTVVEDLSEEELEAMRIRQADDQADAEAKEDAKGKVPEVKEEKAKEKDESEQESTESEEEELEDEGPKFNPKTDIMISDARVLKMSAEIGDIIRTELPVAQEFGRMAAMTAKQVITQKLREAEREIIFNEYKEQEGEILIGTVQRREGRVVLVDIGRAVGVLIPEDQVPSERYNSGDKIKVYVREVSLGTRGPQILLSRTSEELVRSLFHVEIPEIHDGIVEIKGIAREAGARSKIAVSTDDESIDPIGACIGQRGVRIQTIISELSGEKIDVIEWSDDPEIFIISALAPAKIIDIQLNEETREATAIVETDQLSLAIGKAGQNVRLAARLTGWKINIQEEGGSSEEGEEAPEEDEEAKIEDQELDEVAVDAKASAEEVVVDEVEEENSESEDADDSKEESAE